MQKILFFLLALFSFSVQARANSTPYSINHERFVHLNENDKQAVIISTMELMVELESQYQKQVVKSGFSTQRLIKYVQALKKLQNLILGDAVAAPPGVALTSLATQFTDLLKTLGKNGCVYGGYVSKMGELNGRPYCRHPSTMDKKNAQEAAILKAYQTRGNTCVATSTPSKISCNPVIFGYQDIAGTTPICVETSNVALGKGHNTAYECMKKALAEPNKDARLAVVSKAMEENKEAFNKVHSFIFRTCACPEESSINTEYAKYIKPHRTCFGMINTLRALNTEDCGQLSRITPETQFAQDWTKYFGTSGVLPKLDTEKSANFDQVYEKLMNQKAVQAICKAPSTDPVGEDVDPEPENKTWYCETKCNKQAAVKPALPKVECTIVNAGFLKDKEERKPANVENLKALFKSKDVIIEPGATTITVELNDGTKQECPVTIEPDPAKTGYKIQLNAKTVGPDTVEVVADFTIDGEPTDVPAGFKMSWTRKGPGVAQLPKETEGEVVTDSPFTAIRVSLPYEIRATLYDDKGVLVAESFASIPKKDVPKTNPYGPAMNNPPSSQQQRFQFTPYNTSTPGF